MAIGSIASFGAALFYHRWRLRALRQDRDDWKHCEGVCNEQYNILHNRLNAIIAHFQHQKSGTARLVVKMTKGEIT